MAGESAFGSMFEKAGKYAGPVGKAYTAFKFFKGLKEGGIKGGLSSFVPSIGGFGGFGSKGSKTNAMARQYMALVNQFDDQFLKPTVAGMTKVQRHTAPGFRPEGMMGSFRSIMSQFEGAGDLLRNMVGGGDFGSISGKISSLVDLSKRFQKGMGGRGAGPNQNIDADVGALKLPKLDGRPGENISGESMASGFGTFKQLESEGHRFPVRTNITPGSKSLSIGKNLGFTPGILT
jgi:hypothetical protein